MLDNVYEATPYDDTLPNVYEATPYDDTLPIQQSTLPVLLNMECASDTWVL